MCMYVLKETMTLVFISVTLNQMTIRIQSLRYEMLENTIFVIKITFKTPDAKSMYAMKVAEFVSDGVILYCQLDINTFNHDKTPVYQ